jgi:hypothetical protein
MKREYNRPEIIEYGRVDQLTLGSSGPHLDFSWNGTNLTISNDCPQGQWFCVSTS